MFFHYTRCLWCKVLGLGLVRNFRKSEDFKTLERCVAVLPIVPSRDVDDVWFYAPENKDSDSPQVEQFKVNVIEQFVETDVTLWNHYDNHNQRTISHIEGWHHKINNIVSRSHPNFYFFIHIIKKGQSMNEIKILQFSNDGRQNPRKRKYRLIDQRLASLRDRLQAREIDIYHYADAASQLIKLGSKPINSSNYYNSIFMRPSRKRWQIAFHLSVRRSVRPEPGYTFFLQRLFLKMLCL